MSPFALSLSKGPRRTVCLYIMFMVRQACAEHCRNAYHERAFIPPPSVPPLAESRQVCVIPAPRARIRVNLTGRNESRPYGSSLQDEEIAKKKLELHVNGRG